MSPTLIAVIKSFILPPGLILILFSLPLYFFLKKRSYFIYTLFVPVSLLYLLSTPFITRNLASLLETDHAINIPIARNYNANAIVVLGCGRYHKAPEYAGNDSVSACSLIRLHYAAKLQKELQLPIIVSGGRVYGESISEAELMQSVLSNEYTTPVLWAEINSLNTIQNAKYVSEYLRQNDMHKIILVTHAIHMLRAKNAFNKYNVQFMPAPTHYFSVRNSLPGYFDFLPSHEAFYTSNKCLYELIGFIWTRIRY